MLGLHFFLGRTALKPRHASALRTEVAHGCPPEYDPRAEQRSSPPPLIR